jgi:hypothetical protein
MASFDPSKTVEYIVARGVWHNYTIIKAVHKDGKLYITITDYICSYDVNDDFTYLKDTFGLSGEEILALPEFSECVMHGGVLYASRDALHDRLQYDSYDEWQGYQIAANGMTLGEITLPELPVSEDAKIRLYYIDDITNTGQFSEYLLHGCAVRDLAAEDAQLFNMLFKYENEQITGIYQDSGDA